MTRAAQFARVRSLFEAALEHGPAARAAFLDAACGGDRWLRDEVEQLLRCDREPGLVGPERADAEPAAAEDAGGDLIGRTLGAFRIRSVLASGGMGTVYVAEQQQPNRLVALKILSLGLGGEAAARRFRWEAEVLARLRHPGIAQVYAVGVHRTGALEQPWFAMELVADARDLTAYADAERLSVRQRVELLLQACDAVHHGHLHGIVHRDLKPQNLLVDGTGRVKVIDFGIARSTDGHDDERGMRTENGCVLGTLAYMSPDQFAGDTVDLRTDVYSLGVIAFELLAGRRPYELTGLLPWQAADVVRTAPEPQLSRAVPALDRDLDHVVGMAMRREREARYASVAAFADDLRSFLEARPVRARPTSAIYQLRMFARRRRGLVGALVAIALLVAAGLVALSLQNVALRRSERLASSVAAFARGFLAESDVMQSRGSDYTVREALDEAARRLDREALPDPEIEAELLQLVGDTYRGLGVPDAAEPRLQRAVELRRRTLGPAARGTFEAEVSWLLLLRERDRLDEAVALSDDLCARGAGVLGSDDPLWWTLQHQRALVLRDRGDLAAAERIYRDVAAARERILGADAGPTLATLQNLGTLLLARDRPEAAQAVLSECLLRSKRSGDAPVSTWQIADNLAEAWRDLGQLDRAAATHREAMAGFADLLGPDHPLTLGCGYHLLKVLYRQGDLPAMRPLAEDLVARCTRTFGAEHRRTMDVTAALAGARLRLGEVAAGRELFTHVYAVSRQQRGMQNPDTFLAGQNLAAAQLQGGDAAASLQTLDELAAGLPAATDVPPASQALTHMLRARVLVALDRPREAAAAAAAATAALDGGGIGDHPLRREAMELRERARAATGQ